MDPLTPNNMSFGTMERVLNPHLFDAVFPVLAFILVIAIPSAVAVWAITKTLRERDLGEGET